jgi:ERF superfamily protein
MPEPKLSLHKKLAQVMYEAERIPKNGRAPAAMGGFAFVQVGDAADAIRKALAEKSVSMIPTAVEVVGETEHPSGQDGKKIMTTMTVRTTWTLTDGDSGETTVIQSLGSGGDTGDKAAPKAQSSSMKYALLMGFLLSTGDDPEQTDTSDRQSRPVASGFVGTAARPPADATHPASVPADGDKQNGTEHEEMMGRVSRRGLVKKGTAEGYKLDWRQGPEGHVTGFRLEIDGEKNIPQCLVVGPVGEKLFRAYPDATTLVGTPATVAGLLYNVRRSDKPGSWYRLHVDRFENADWTLTNETEPALPAPSDDIPLVGENEAPTEPLGLVPDVA